MKNKVDKQKKQPQKKKIKPITEDIVRSKSNPYPVIGDYPSVNKHCNRGN